MEIKFRHYMLCWTKGAKQKYRRQTKFIYSDELFRH